MLLNVNLVASNNQLESRMREIRQSGSVGGETQINESSLPLSLEEIHRKSLGQSSTGGVNIM